MGKPWWRRHVMRIYHPNASEWEFAELDVKRLISDCLLTNAESIVVNGGGLYAFYPSTVPYHHISPHIGERDLVGEITREAHAYGLRVIARVDFSKARELVWRDHPEWFQRQADGRVARSHEYYITCPLAGYQNAAFAYPVLREILERYDVDGFYLSAAGFNGYCACATCAASFGNPIPEDQEDDPAVWERFQRWRANAVAEQLEGYYRFLQELKEDVFFVAELAGPQNPEWADTAAHYLPALSHSFSQLLLTAGGVGAVRQWRWWVGLAAKQARALRRKRPPIIHVEAQMRDLQMSRASVPPAEFALACYQALAHGAGLKISTFGMPTLQNNPCTGDPRMMPAVAEVLGLIRQQEEVLDSMVPIAPVALVWPADILWRYSLQDEANWRLRQEFLGLYEGLRSRHVLFELVCDTNLQEKALDRYEVLILPGATWLNAEQADVLVA